MKKKFPPKYACLLGRDPETSRVCEENQCCRCGWNERESAFRRALLQVKGLTLCSDGLRRLVMPARNYQKEESR